jgi:hypothetical protein
MLAILLARGLHRTAGLDHECRAYTIERSIGVPHMPLILTEDNPLAASEIITQTRKGNPIANAQASLITIADKKDAGDRRARWPTARIRGNEVVPHYNCHGLTFASRRTAVEDSAEVRKIIGEDGYTEVVGGDVLPGDVILYVSPEDGDVEHSGIIVALGVAPLYIPMVVSKWGKGFEVVHAANYCPYTFGHAKYYRIKE